MTSHPVLLLSRHSRFAIRHRSCAFSRALTQFEHSPIRSRPFSGNRPSIQHFPFQRFSVSIACNMNFSRRVSYALIPLALLGSLCAQEVQERFRPAMQEAAEARTLEPNLRKLTDEIGGRVPGSAGNEAAVAWAEQAFKAAGADSVNVEPFTMATSWTEADTKVTITSPVKFT